MPRKVLLIAPQPFFSTRGTPINVRALAESLAVQGMEVHLLVYPFGEKISIPGVRIHRSWGVPGISAVPVGASWRKLALDIPLSFAALALACRHRFAAFHGVEEGGFIAGTLGLIFQRPYIYDMDSCMVEQLQTGRFGRFKWVISLLGRMECFFLRRAKAILTVASSLTKKAEAAAPLVPVFQIEDFPMESSQVVDTSLVASLRETYLSGARKVMLYTGNFEYYQGVELALEAWKIAKAKYADTFSGNRLLLVGGTPEQVISLEKLCRSLEIENEVIFTGQRPPEQMGSFLAIADAVVSPRIIGGNTPLKLFTYMAARRPVAATAIPAHVSVLDSDSAFLAEPSAETFAEAVHGALHDPCRTRRAEMAFELVCKHYSKKNFEEKLQQLYSFVLPTRAELPAAEVELSVP